MLVRYLYEFQYLRFSAVADRRTFFLRSTWFDADFIDRGVLDEATFDALTAAVAGICDCYAVDESRFVATGIRAFPAAGGSRPLREDAEGARFKEA